MFTSLLKFNFLFLFSFLSNSLHAAMFLNPPGEPSNNFDGEYRFSHICFKKDGSQQQGNKYDGSKFIIIKGIISNNRDGAGRYTVFKDSRIDKDGKILIKGKRKSKNYSILGKFDNKYKTEPIKLKGQYSSKNKPLSKGNRCEIIFTRTGDVKNKKSLKQNIGLIEINFDSKNTNDEISLLKDQGLKISIKTKLRNIESFKNGLIIIVPSSTPNMEDEEIYETEVKDLGLTTAIIYGAGPRFQEKYGSTYTSSMIMYDVISLIRKLENIYGKPKEIILMGSSTGALAIFKAAWQAYIDKYSSMKLISKIFMINAACPDKFEGEINKNVKIFTINGKKDDSTPGWICKTLKKSKNFTNIINLEYEGAHHFESTKYAPTSYEPNGMHALPTCSINYKRNLHQIIKLRDGTSMWDTEKKGFGKDQKNWFGNNCVKSGHYQGYEKIGAKKFWGDVRSIIIHSSNLDTLKGYSN